MSDSLAGLFSAASPPPAPRDRTPSPQPTSDPLFLSPGDTPIKNNALRADTRQQSTTPFLEPHAEASSSRRREATSFDDSRGDTGPVPTILDPLDVSARYGDPGEAIVDPLAGLDDDQPVKKKRVMAKIDEERLTGPDGFPALMKAAKKFKVRGKNREAEDLKELLGVYQMWAHGMFPKGDFHSTVARVEVVCRKRRMEMAMKGYREAFYPPPPRSPSPIGSPPSGHSPIGLPGLPGSPGDDAHTGDLASSAGRPDALSRQQSGPPPEEDDGPDMDELIAMEEMERDQQARPEVGGPAGDEDWDLYA